MATAIPQNRVRVGGLFTIFTFAGQPIAFCQQVAHTSPQPVGAGMSAIQPMDEPYPVEIITPIAAGPGQLVLNLFELFGSGGHASKAWDRLGVNLGTVNPVYSSVNDPSQITQNLTLGSTGPGQFAGLVDIVDIFITQAKLDPTQTQVVKYIRPLSRGAAVGGTPYSEEYIGCMITNVVDGEQIEIGTLEVIKQITITYRYLLRNGTASQAFAVRDAAF